MTAFLIVLAIALVLCLAFAISKGADFAGVGGEINQGGGQASYTCLGNVNNPGNLVANSNVSWKGETTQPGQKFESFDTLRNGVRAWYINLFGKVQKGTITNTTTMIDVLTPASSENPEPARNNYKAQVAKATSWLELGKAVFDFEACPSWTNADGNEKTYAIVNGYKDAVNYKCAGQVPPYFTS